MAKIASDMDKPDGLFIIRPHEVEGFLRDLPVKKIPGVGDKLLEILNRLRVKTCGDVLTRDREFWVERLGKYGGALHDRARGIDPGGVVPVTAAKSCSAENSYNFV